MLIILTLITTWLIKNWWKVLLLLIATIVLHEYQVHKHANDPGKDTEGSGSENGTETGD